MVGLLAFKIGEKKMKNKDKYDLRDVLQIESGEDEHKIVTLMFKDGTTIELMNNHYIQLLDWLEKDVIMNE